jgi:hypothetical protein
VRYLTDIGKRITRLMGHWRSKCADAECVSWEGDGVVFRRVIAVAMGMMNGRERRWSSRRRTSVLVNGEGN